MKKVPQCNKVDGYKLGHIEQYIAKTNTVYGNMTPRSNRLARVIREHYDGKMTLFGVDYAILEMIQGWKETFFDQPKDQVITAYARRIKGYLGPDHGDQQIDGPFEFRILLGGGNAERQGDGRQHDDRLPAPEGE